MTSNVASLLNNPSHRILRGRCIAIPLIILTAGLWPFNLLTEYKVAWLPDQDDVHFFCGQGIIVVSRHQIFLIKLIGLAGVYHL